MLRLMYFYFMSEEFDNHFSTSIIFFFCVSWGTYDIPQDVVVLGYAPVSS
jgi:hypothetical protein